MRRPTQTGTTVLLLGAGVALLVLAYLDALSPVLRALSLVVGLALVVAAVGQMGRLRARDRRRIADLERQAAELRSLSAASRAVRTGLDLDSLLETVYLQTAHLLKVRDFTVALKAGETSAEAVRFPLVIRAGRRVGAVRDPARAPARALVNHVIETRAPLLIAAGVADFAARQGLELPSADLVSWMGAPLWLGVPLATTDSPVGCIVVESRDPNRRFTEHDLNLLSIIAAQAGVTLDHVQLYTRTDRALERRVRQLSALDDIGREITSTLDLERVFQLVLDRAMSITGSMAGALFLCDEADAAKLQIVGARGYPEAVLAGFRQSPVRWPDELGAQVLREGRAVALRELGEGAGYRALCPEARALVGVPLRREDAAAVGVIALESDDAGAYPEEDVRFLVQLATQAAIAVENARLFQNVRVGRDQLQAVLNSTYAGMLMIDRSGQVVLTNPQVEALTGLPGGAWAGATLDALLRSRPDIPARLGFGAAPEALADLLDALRAGDLPPLKREQYEIDSRHIERSIELVRDEVGALIGLLIALRDVTEAEHLREAREALSSMIVHDLRSPLTAVQGSLLLIDEVAAETGESQPALQQMTGTALRAIRRLLNMVESLLDISRMESGVLELEREPAMLGPLIEQVFADLRPLADELEVTLDHTMPDAPPYLDIDADRIRRVLLNLVDNALKFAPAGDAVRVVVGETGAQDAAPGWVRVDVIDRGPGVPEADKERLFEPFAQVRERRGRRRGTGLGLAFCRLAVEAHGGRIWVSDGPDGGSVFSFTLPAAAVSNSPHEEAGD